MDIKKKPRRERLDLSEGRGIWGGNLLRMYGKKNQKINHCGHIFWKRRSSAV